MENIKNDCGCDTNCCQPKKTKPWKKTIFVLIFLIAAVIIIVKVTTGNMSNASQSPCEPAKCSHSGCCDTNKANIVTIKNDAASCCPSSNK